MDTALAARLSIRPEDELPRKALIAHAETRVLVSNETTLGASRRLVESGCRPLALNFANGEEPGGGFLRGALAQEETLCRSSALYLTLEGDPMYEAHGKRPRSDATDWAIYSPLVPVFRTDMGEELPQPWLLDFLTCAAPYAPHVGQPESGDLLQRRIHRVLDIARAYGHSTLVLGAWGCGAFGNDPRRTALDFQSALEGEYQGAFAEVVFAITDWSTERLTLGAFRNVFSPRTQPEAKKPAGRQEDWNLGRFVEAQEERGTWDRALAEIKRGRKTSHWMWFVFPQLDGLGSSSKARHYGIKNLSEAKAYFDHPILGTRLLLALDAVLKLDASADEVFGWIDSIKLRSCVTLFSLAAPEEPRFQSVLAKFFDGTADTETLKMLR